MKNKEILTQNLIDKLKEIAKTSIKNNKLNRCLASVAFSAEYLYQYNQYYTDDDLEGYLCQVADKLKEKNRYAKFNKQECEDIILVYDGFGLDIRGVILMYLNALGMNKYHVIYITNSASIRKIPSIVSMCNKYKIEMKYIDMKDYLKWTNQLARIFENYKPRAAFFYTYPFDVSAVVAFHIYDGIIDRYQIDLTDHAFWLGKSAFDYCLGSREMSATIEHFHRGIPKDRLIKLGVNLLIKEYDDHSGLPFDPLKTRYIFSGGSLYKTLGDPNKQYYKIVNYILNNHSDIKFLYAGSGDDSEIKKIVKKYPKRAFYISERKDFYYLIKHCVFYLNTYPMFGGMMMKYSALAGKLPITLRHNSDSDGLLLNQANCRIEYDTYEDLIEDVDYLLKDADYLKKREKLLIGSVITEQRFVNNIRTVIEEHKTDYYHKFFELDTSKFRKEYYERFNYNNEILKVAKIRNISLFSYFPVVFIKGFYNKLIYKIKRSK